jgi:hypothetical protein
MGFKPDLLSELKPEPSQFQFIFQNWDWRFFVSKLTDYQNWNWNRVNSNLVFGTGIGGSLEMDKKTPTLVPLPSWYCGNTNLVGSLIPGVLYVPVQHPK